MKGTSLRKDQVFLSLQLPEHLAKHPSLEVQYVSPQDISKMVIREYTGWWNDLPSEWSPAAREAQAELIVELAGGIDAVQQLVLDAFKARILDPESNTQEMLAYLDRMTEARQRQLAAE